MRVIITGAAGKIGQILISCLSNQYNVVGIDRKEGKNVVALDILTSQEKISQLIQEGDIIIHLAWDVREAGTALSPILEDNKRMAETMFDLALSQKARRFILASSVHVMFGHFGYRHPGIVEHHEDLHRSNKIKTKENFYPLGAYGASKVYLEELGHAYASRGLQVIAVRFGHVTSDNNYGEYPFWLSHPDCCQFIEKCITAKNLPNFSTYFATSDNACNPFDISSSGLELGYQPKDGSPCPIASSQ